MTDGHRDRGLPDASSSSDGYMSVFRDFVSLLDEPYNGTDFRFTAIEEYRSIRISRVE